MTTALSRFPDWDLRLARFLIQNRTRAFQWGEWDCALFVCGAIQAMTGTDCAEWFRGHYSTRKSARDLMRAFAGTANFHTFFIRMAEHFALAEIPSGSAGDIALVKHAGRSTLGIIALDSSHVLIAGETCAGIHGLGRVELVEIQRIWKI